MTPYESFGKLVKQRRTTLDLTQKELAHRVGCAAITIRKIEADDLRPSVQIAERLAMALKIPLEDRANFVRLARTARLSDPTPPQLPTPPLQPGEVGLDDLSGRAIGGYELGERIGEGGFGAVYRASQPLIEREVAIKIILPKYANHPDFIRRFEAEARTVARLEHPHIVPLYDYWREPGVAYLVMRLMRGESLHDRLQLGPLPLNDTVQMLDQIGSALNAAHRLGVIHRDIKPANVLLDEDINAYLSDFGIAKNMNVADETQQGQLIGSPAYLSPEQIKSEPIRPQTDIYSLGILLYEMLTGQKPFHGPTPVAFLQQHLNHTLPLLADTNPALPEDLNPVIAKATAKNPADRFESVAELMTAVNQALSLSVGHNITPTTPSTPVAPIDMNTIDWEELENPYKGLHAFTEADADRYYGRESLIQELLAKMEEPHELARFVAVVGPSGCGKSSVVKAGLLPALRRGALPGSENWFYVDLTPGAHPWEEVEAALLRVAVNPPASLLGQLQEGQRGFLRAINRILPDDEETELVLVIDQFEELFTLLADDTQCEHFLNSLVQATLDERSRLRLIMTLRADFYDRPLQYVDFGDLLRQRTISVLPLTPDELEQAISQPAAQAGVMLEPGLLPHIMQAVADQPGGLPLLQYALMELFNRRDRHLMTLDAYQQIGGVTGALAQRADEIYAALDAAGQAASRQLFLRLVTLGEGVEDTRRRVRQSELDALSNHHSPITDYRSLITEYGRYRLLTFDRDPLTREPTVEVAHEALLREWGLLRRWLEESRADVRLQRLLAAGTVEWLAADRDEGFLLRGGRLDQFEDWVETTTIALTADEQAFLQASLAARQQREAEEEARRQRELKTAQQLAAEQSQRAEEQSRSASRLRRLAIGLALILVLAIGAALLAANQTQTAVAESNQRATAESEAVAAGQRADDERDAAVAAEAMAVAAGEQADEQRDAAQYARATAEAEAIIRAEAEAIAIEEREEAVNQAQISLSRELAAAALNNLDVEPERSLLLALHGMEIKHTWEAENALHLAIQNSPLRERLPIPTGISPWWLTIHPNGQQLFASGSGGGVMWDLSNSAVVFSYTVPTGDFITGADFSPDGSLMVMPGASFNETDVLPGKITVIDPENGQPFFDFIAHDQWIREASISPNGSLLATASPNAPIKIWDLEASRLSNTGQLVRELCCLQGSSIDLFFSPDNQKLATIMGDGFLKVWDVATGDETLIVGPDIIVADYSPDGNYLISSNNEAFIQVWDTVTGERLISANSRDVSEANDIAFSPDGTAVAISMLSGKIILWDFSPNGLEERLALLGHESDVGRSVFTPDGNSLFSTSHDGTVRHWDISSNASTEGGGILLSEENPRFIRDAALLSDDNTIVTVGNDGLLRLWHRLTGENLMNFEAQNSEILELDISQDGTLLATAGGDGKVTIWDTESWQKIREIEAHESQDVDFEGSLRGVRTVSFSPDGQKIATGGIDSEVYIWDVQSGKQEMNLSGHPEGWVTNTIFSPDGSLLATSSAIGLEPVVNIWDSQTGKLLQTMSPDNWQTDNRGIWGVDFSPNGEHLIFGRTDGIIELWHLPNSWLAAESQAKKADEIESTVGFIMDTRFVPHDGQRIAISGLDGSVEIRDVEKGDLELTFQHPAGVKFIEFSKDGYLLMTISLDNNIRLYLIDSKQLMAVGEERATRPLTTAECQQYLHMDECPAQN